MSEPTVTRLDASHAAQIRDCFRRVYGDTYANELFYDLEALGAALSQGRLRSVGALDDTGKLLAHMAMVCHPTAGFAELGNTVVDPEARGGGLAWKVGDELSRWTIERGYPAYLHYPTTDHHIMQKRSVERGFETGLMLGYIPAETDGQVNPDKPALRSASTVVFNPYQECPSASCHVPVRYRELLTQLADQAGLSRTWNPSGDGTETASNMNSEVFAKRGLCRYSVTAIGTDFDAVVARLATDAPCEQLDLPLDDPAIHAGVEAAHAAGFVFCAWMPGYRHCDVLRLQRIDRSTTDLQPAVVNPVAQELAELIRSEL